MIAPCHTTRHAGLHRAFREFEVMRDEALPAESIHSSTTIFSNDSTYSEYQLLCFQGISANAADDLSEIPK